MHSTAASSLPPLRVVAAVDAYTVSGMGKAVLEFAREAALPNSGVHCIVLTFVREQPHTVFTDVLASEGIETAVVRERRRFDTAVLANMRSAIRDLRPHVLWTNGAKPHFLARAAGLHREIPWVAFHHGYTSTNLLTRVYNQFDRWSLRAATRVLTVCRPFADALVRSCGVKPERIRVQHMPIRIRPETEGWRESARRTVREKYGIPASETVVLSVGRLSAEKGHSVLISAVSAIRNSPTILFVGDGPEGTRLEAQAQQLGVKTVFAGHQNDVARFYASADLFALPSYSEGSPNVLLEALAASLPVVASAVGGIPEMVADKQSALLVPARSPEMLAAALSNLQDDPALCRTLIDGGRQVVLRHTPERYFGALEATFREASASR